MARARTAEPDLTENPPDPTAPVSGSDFAEVEVPVVARGTALPNPFKAVVATMEVGGKARTGPVPYLTTDDETADKAQARVRRQLDDLAKERDVTIRTTFTPATPEAPHKVTFWLVERIVRKKTEAEVVHTATEEAVIAA